MLLWTGLSLAAAASGAAVQAAPDAGQQVLCALLRQQFSMLQCMTDRVHDAVALAHHAGS